MSAQVICSASWHEAWPAENHTTPAHLCACCELQAARAEAVAPIVSPRTERCRVELHGTTYRLWPVPVSLDDRACSQDHIIPGSHQGHSNSNRQSTTLHPAPEPDRLRLTSATVTGMATDRGTSAVMASFTAAPRLDSCTARAPCPPVQRQARPMLRRKGLDQGWDKVWVRLVM